MTRNTSLTIRLSALAVVAALLGTAGAGAVVAQDARSRHRRRSRPSPSMPLKVTVVIARYQGEKRTGSLPFVLTVNGNDRSTSLQMGADVPYPQGAGGSYLLQDDWDEHHVHCHFR